MKSKILLLMIIALSLKAHGQLAMGGTLVPNNRYAFTTNAGATDVHAFGIGNFAAMPNSILHVNSNLINATTPPGLISPAEVFRTDAPAGFSHWRMEQAGVQRFRITADTDSILSGATRNGTYTLFTNSTVRFKLAAGNGANTGRATLSDAVPAGFVARDRLHLYQTAASNVFTRFGHLVTGSGLGDGAAVGIDADGDFSLIQYENRYFDLFSPSNATATNQVSRFRMMPNGQIFIGDSIDAENVIYNRVVGVDSVQTGGYSNYSQVPTSLLNVRGPINSCADLDQITGDTTLTILYAYTTPSGDPTYTGQDGFRFRQNLHFEGNYLDALVFEKTDGDSNDPDGGIAFSNTGTDNKEELSLYINGKGRTYAGTDPTTTLTTRFTIDAETTDRRRSGLQFTDVNSLSAHDVFTATGMLSLDSSGHVIWVPLPTGTGGGNGTGNGINSLILPTTLSAGGVCANGGVQLDFGLDTNANNILDSFEIDTNLRQIICNGQNGATGPAGPTGPAGTPGTGGGLAGAHNGTSLSTDIPNFVALGQNELQVNNPGQLTSHREIPMNGKRLHFTNAGNTGTGGRISIGRDANTNIDGKLEIMVQPTDIVPSALSIRHETNGWDILNGARIFTTGSSTNINYGMRLEASNATARNIGLTSVTEGGRFAEGLIVDAHNGTRQNYGVVARTGILQTTGVYSDEENIAFQGTAYGSATWSIGGLFQGGSAGESSQLASSPTSRNIGVEAIAKGAGIQNFGVRATVPDNLANDQYAIWAAAIGANKLAGYFWGNVRVEGNIDYTGTLTDISDARFKQNIQAIQNPLATINALNPVSFHFDTTNYPDFDFDTHGQLGLIAQEVENVLPELVYEQHRPAQYDSLGNEIMQAMDYKSLNYDGFIALSLKGIQELNEIVVQQQTDLENKDSLIAVQQSQINDLNTRLTQLENCLSALLPTLCNMNQQAIQQNPMDKQQHIKQQLEVLLSDTIEGRNAVKHSVILSQNVPNPFAEQTVIEFSLPATVQQAQMLFYNAQGQLIQSLDINERGTGQITVFAHDLSAGIYTYSLVTDGKVIMSKKMMKK